MTVTIGELTLARPVMTAAGCGGSEVGRFADLAALGAYVSRTLTLDPRSGGAGGRVIETPSGLLVDEIRDNPGLHAFLATELPELAKLGVRTVVAVTGRSLGDYGELARRAGGAPGVSALEVGFLDEDPYAAAKSLSVVRRDAPRGVAVLAKVPLGGPLLDLARELAKSGADGLVVGHPHRGVVIDPVTLRPARGGLGGPATLPLAVEAVWRVHEALPGLPLIGVGGIRSGADALAMMAAGASAVQVGTALLHDPTAAHRIQEELGAALDKLGLKPADVVGVAHSGGLG